MSKELRILILENRIAALTERAGKDNGALIRKAERRLKMLRGE